jgi:uncharacterized phiE125 gp8 family phage protein
VDDDKLLQVYIGAAVSWAEGATHRTIFQRSHRWVLRDFPDCRYSDIRLPRGKASSVSGITYVAGGQTVTLRGPSAGSPASADYQEDLTSDSGGVLMPPQGGTWPSVDYDAVAPVVVTFTAGWPPAAVPSELQHAILFAVEDMYDMRGQNDFDPSMVTAAGPKFSARESLISSYRLTRWYA